MKQRLFRTILLCCIGVLIGAGIGLFSATREQSATSPASGRIANAAGVGGPYTLINQDGKTVSEKDFLTTHKLIYFGFTCCPAICPTELQKISSALKLLPEETQKKIQPIFITIDPERDTADVLKKYVSLFNDRLIGLTGSVDQVEAVKKAYKIYGAKVPAAEGSAPDEYTMDHSSYIYFMTPDDQMVYLFKTEDQAGQIAEKLKAYFASL